MQINTYPSDSPAAGETLALVSMMRDAKKSVMVVFKDGQGRLLHVPLGSDIQVSAGG